MQDWQDTKSKIKTCFAEEICKTHFVISVSDQEAFEEHVRLVRNVALRPRDEAEWLIQSSSGD